MRMLKATGLALALALASVPASIVAQPSAITEQQATSMVRAMKPQRGKIVLPEAQATLDLGQSYDFYGPADARTILVTFWGNPPEAITGVLGLVMPAGKSPLSDSWGAVVTFEKSGYVSDTDAAEIDYAELLSQLREGEATNNSERTAAGYPTMNLAGWAEQPNYDKAKHSVVWAQELRIGGQTVHSLNYDVRSLGRNGVLSLNLISQMPKLAEVKTAARDFANHASFDPGARYEDFNPDTDATAEYGIGGLVAAGVGVAAAKKLGLLAVLLKFLKPLLIGVVALAAVFRGRIAGLFSRKKDPLEGE